MLKESVIPVIILASKKIPSPYLKVNVEFVSLTKTQNHIGPQLLSTIDFCQRMLKYTDMEKTKACAFRNKNIHPKEG